MEQLTSKSKPEDSWPKFHEWQAFKFLLNIFFKLYGMVQSKFVMDNLPAHKLALIEPWFNRLVPSVIIYLQPLTSSIKLPVDATKSFFDQFS